MGSMRWSLSSLRHDATRAVFGAPRRTVDNQGDRGRLSESAASAGDRHREVARGTDRGTRRMTSAPWLVQVSGAVNYPGRTPHEHHLAGNPPRAFPPVPSSESLSG